uniref:ATP synthase complex subunit 8 n=1 Tax=Leiodidae sp. BMNH 1274323 TaxID=1796520 RepID=A0A126TFF0_9COLE|nr:ATP synthase F0 subunit 8 [Leiodidae sp. BMNH 1274323]
MPQMAPLMWVTLFIIFSSIFLLTNMINYFIINYNIKKKINKMNFKKINWKW